MANRITTLFDLDSKGFDSGLKKLRTEVAKADGPINKLKAAGSGLGSVLQANVGAAATAAGAALVTFGVKSVRAFQDAALAAGQFADATGVSVQAASRFIEVAGDLGIESGSVQSAIQKMNMAIAKGGPTVDQFGDAIVRAKDGTVDSAASFQNLVTKIGAIKDPTQRALAAQQVFGKGYADIAELMQLSAGQLAASLNAVSDSQVIDDAELAKARKFRDSLDALQDKVNGLMMDFGEDLIPVITDVTDAFVGMTDTFKDLSDAFEGVAGSGLVDFFSPLDNIASGLDKVFGDNVSTIDRFKGGIETIASIIPGASEMVSDWADETERLNGLIEHGTEQSRELARIYGERVPPAIEESNVAVFRFRDATADAEAKARDLETQWAYLFGTLDSEKALLNLEQQFDDLYEVGVKAYVAGVEGSEDAAKAQLDHRLAIVETKDEVARYAQEVLGLPVEQVTQILAEIDAGKLDEVERRLGILSRNRTVSLDIIAKGGAGWMVPIDGKKAKGGPVDAGKTYLVGEQGQELFVPKQSGTIVPNNQLGGIAASSASGSAPMVVNITTGADPEDVVRAIEKFKRRNGSLPF